MRSWLCAADEPLWSEGRVGECVTRLILGFWIPLAAVFISAATLGILIPLRSGNVSPNFASDEQVASADGVAPAGVEQDDEDIYSNDMEQQEGDTIASLLNGQIVQRTDSRLATSSRGLAEASVNCVAGDASRAGNVGVEPSFVTSFSRLATSIETFALIVDTALNSFLLAASTYFAPAGQQSSSTLVAIGTSAYLLMLVAARARAHSASFQSSLQLHSLDIYLLQWLCMLVTAHSALIEKAAMRPMLPTLLRLAIFTTLLILYVTAARRPPENTLDSNTLTVAAPEDMASIASRLTLSWITSLVGKGHYSTLQYQDLCHLSHEQRSSHLSESFLSSASSSASLVKRLLIVFKRRIITQALWAIVLSISLFIPPQLLRAIIEYVESPDSMLPSTAWLLSMGIMLCGLIASLTSAQCNWEGAKLGAGIKGVLVSEMTAKALRRASKWTPGLQRDTGKPQAKANLGVDEVLMSLVKVDVDKIGRASSYMHVMWISTPAQVMIAIFMLYSIMGISGIIGVFSSFAVLPFLGNISKRQAAANQQRMHATGTRTQLATETVHGVRIIKYYIWEACFEGRVNKPRQMELGALRRWFKWWAASVTTTYCIPLVVIVLTFALYTVVFGNQLTAAVAFPAIAIFSILRMSLDRLWDMANFAPSAKASLEKIVGYLGETEVQGCSKTLLPGNKKLGFEQASVKWFGPDPAPA